MISNFIKEYFKDIEMEILKDELGKKRYWFKAIDIAKILKVTSIRALIQNYTKNEKEVRETVKESGNQQTIYLSEKGIYRLLYNIKSELGERFRLESGSILSESYFVEDDNDNDILDFLN